MESPLKRRAQDDLVSPRRKFRPFQFRPFQSHYSQFPIHEAGSLHDCLVNVLPPVASHVSPTEDRENLDPNPAEPRRNPGRRRRNPLHECSDTGNNADKENYDTSKYRESMTVHDRNIYTAETSPNSSECCTLHQDYTATEASVGTEGSDTNKSGDCWVTLDGETYVKGIGPLARVSGDELKTLKWLRSNDGVSLGEYNPSISFERPLKLQALDILTTTSCNPETPTLNFHSTNTGRNVLKAEAQTYAKLDREVDKPPKGLRRRSNKSEASPGYDEAPACGQRDGNVGGRSLSVPEHSQRT